MMPKNVSFSLALLMLILTLATTSSARLRLDQGKTQDDYFTAAALPAYCMTEHNVGKMVLAVTNYGCFGDGFTAGASSDCFTGLRVMSCEYPKGSRTRYNFASAFWFGAIVGRDTLVSVGSDGWFGGTFEMFPDEAQENPIPPRKDGSMIYRSVMDPTSDAYRAAISEQDYIGVYTDTFTEGVIGLMNDEITDMPHQPLNIEVTQRSFAWSYPYAEDFILFDYAIKNIGTVGLQSVYMGVYCDADIMGATQQNDGFDDDIAGFTHRLPLEYCDRVWDTEVNAAWIADNSGKLDSPPGSDATRVPNVTATRIVRTPSDSLKVSFNWWVSNGNSALDFGPQRKGFVRDLIVHGGRGTPSGDRSKYAFLSNGEFDYDQFRTAEIRAQDSLWSFPPQTIASDISDGFDTRYLLSFGPFNIDPGQTLPLSLAWVGGENFHTDPSNADFLRENSYSPDQYEDNLNFTDLGANSLWASWIYDNPGVDTDSDGYFGEFHLVCDDSTIYEIDSITDPEIMDTIWAYDMCDTCWYQGDGIPDFRGASPPPAPAVWVEPEVSRVRVRWNGLRSETTEDVFSRQDDFEGYRVWVSRDSLDEADYSVQTSYDREDYNKLIYNSFLGEWELIDVPYTAQALRCLYGSGCNDQTFDPNLYSQASNPFQVPGFPDSVFLFVPQDYNRSELGITTEIRKTYPHQPYPSTLSPELARTDELTDDGYLKYFEYYYYLENLLPTVEYYVSVTAFDYGSPQSGLASLETSRTNNFHKVYPLNSVQTVMEEGLEAFVYPNPYIGDGRYKDAGYEDDVYGSDERDRKLRFANLPAKCKISIFSLDGDLVDEIDHDKELEDPEASIDYWDMITRNTQPIVSGIYYYTIDDGTNVQIGKFVVIM